LTIRISCFYDEGKSTAKEGSDMQSLTLEVGTIIADKALEKGRELGLVPLTVAVLDAGGQILVG